MPQASCLCGSVKVTVTTDLPAPNACHCNQCRKQSGHYWASVDLKSEDVKISGEDHITWYQASSNVRRGFCKTCGSFLFWDPIHNDTIAVAMGAFDEPTQTELALHIFVAQKGDYYHITDGLPQNLR